MPNYVYRGANTVTYKHLPGFKNIVAWQAASDLTALLNQLVAPFSSAHFHLADQMRGAAISVAGSLAEGYASGSLPNYLRCCNHARGALAELGSYLQDCERAGLAQGEALATLLRQYNITTYLLDRLIRGLINKELSGTWDNSHQLKEAPAAYTAQPQPNATPGDDFALYADLGTDDDLPDVIDPPTP